MTVDTDNLVLARLRDIRGVLDKIVVKLDEVTSRISHVERSSALQAVQFAEHERAAGRNGKAHRSDRDVGRIAGGATWLMQS